MLPKSQTSYTKHVIGCSKSQDTYDWKRFTMDSITTKKVHIKKTIEAISDSNQNMGKFGVKFEIDNWYF